MTATVAPISDTTRDIELTENLTLRHIARFPGKSVSGALYLVEFHDEPLCLVRRQLGGAKCMALDLDDHIGSGPNYASALVNALSHFARKANAAAKEWAEEMVKRLDPKHRAEAREQLERSVIRHDRLRAELQALYAAIAEEQRLAEAEEERAMADQDDTPF